MKNKKIISGITALIMASSAAIYAGAETKNTFNPADFTSYFHNSYKGDMNSYDFDVNRDNKVDILDMIYAKSSAEGETEIDADKFSVEYFNSAAKALSAAASSVAQELETAGTVLAKTTYSSDELKNTDKMGEAEREMAERINEEAEFYGISRWVVVINPDNSDAICITGDNILQRTGAYPGMIPRTLNIPFSSGLAEFAAVPYFEWNKDFGKYRSPDPSQGEISDFSAYVCLSERERISKELFSVIQTIAQEYETMGKAVPDGIISSDDDSEFVKYVIKNAPECGTYRWHADIRSFEVKGVTAENPLDGFCGSWPKAVPGRLNIPYSDDLIKFASDSSKSWMEDYSEYTVREKEQLKAAEFSEKVPTPELNSYAKAVYTSAQTLLQEYETMGIKISFDDKSDTSEIYHRFSEELMKMLPYEMKNKGIRWEITAENYIVTGVAAVCEDAVGTYPNAVPADMRIPYSEDITGYASGNAGIWKEKFSQYTLEVSESGLKFYSPNTLRWIRKASVNSCNSNAKSVFTNAQTVLQEMETNGEKLPSGMVTSDDSTDFVKKLKDNLNSFSVNKWAVYISGDTVTGAVCSSDSDAVSGVQYYDTEKDKIVYSPSPLAGRSYTGSYPNYVPSDMEICYGHNLVKNYENDINLWNWDNASYITDTPVQSENPPAENISQTSKALINAYNSSAAVIFNGASTVLMEHELFGDTVPDGLITSDDKSEISAEINGSVIGGGNRKWALYVRDGIAAGIVYTENGNVTGSYPAAVSSAVRYDHSLALKYMDNSMDW